MIEDIKLTPGEPIINNAAKLINSKVINISNDLDKELDFNKTHKLFATLKHERQVLNDIAFERLPEPELKQYKDFL